MLSYPSPKQPSYCGFLEAVWISPPHSKLVFIDSVKVWSSRFYKQSFVCTQRTIHLNEVLGFAPITINQNVIWLHPCQKWFPVLNWTKSPGLNLVHWGPEKEVWLLVVFFFMLASIWTRWKVITLNKIDSGLLLMQWVKQRFTNGFCVYSISHPAGWGAAEQATEQWHQRTVETPIKTQSQGKDTLLSSWCSHQSALSMGVSICFCGLHRRLSALTNMCAFKKGHDVNRKYI